MCGKNKAGLILLHLSFFWSPKKCRNQGFGETKISIQTRSTYRGNGMTVTKWWREEKQVKVLKLETMNNVGMLNAFYKRARVWCPETTEEKERHREREKVDWLTKRQREEDQDWHNTDKGEERRSGRCCVKKIAIVSHVSVNLFWHCRGGFCPQRRTYYCIFVSTWQTEWQAGDNSSIDE